MEDSRSKNLFWLLSEDYNINPNLDFITKENINSEIFQTALFGFAHRFYDMNSVMKIIDNVSNKTDIFMILMIILDNNLKEKMLNERNGLEDFDRLQKLYYFDKYYRSNPVFSNSFPQIRIIGPILETFLKNWKNIITLISPGQLPNRLEKS